MMKTFRTLMTMFFLMGVILGVSSTTVLAVPCLGVATDGGYVSGGDPAQAYQTFWGPFLGTGTYEGFQIVDGNLHVFTNITGADIYLGWYTGTTVGSVTFDVAETATTTSSFILYSGSQFDGYTPPNYTFVNLGPVDSDWSSLPSPPFNPDPFSTLDVTLNDFVVPAGNYIFAVADTDGVLGISSKDQFSPKTSSAVPEPSTLLLLGSGLLGIVAFRNKIQR